MEKRVSKSRKRDQYTVVLEDIRDKFTLIQEVVKSDLRTVKNDLKAKVDREEFESLEERVERLEQVARAR